MYLHELYELTDGTLCGDAAFTGICDRAECVRKGDLYVCLEGAHVDGHDYAGDAVAAGAAAVLCARRLALDVPQLVVPNTRRAIAVASAHFWGVDQMELCLVGVTGTNGKTTTAYMLRRIFALAGKPSAYVGTLGVVADHLLMPPTLTTPDPTVLMPLLASLYERGVRYVFLEVSAHAAYWHKVDGLKFRAMIFTNLTEDHLDFFADMESYAAAKASLFCPSRTALGVVNVDDPMGRTLARNHDLPVLTYGLQNPADVFAVNVREDVAGVHYVINAYDVLCKVDTCLHGTFNVYNALAATTVCGYLGVDLRYVAGALRDVDIPGRFHVVEVGGVHMVVDYAHTPDGLRQSLQAARKMTEGKLTVVFGCGGDREHAKRREMGRIAEQLADVVVLTNDNPRSESPEGIVRDIEAGMLTEEGRLVVMDRAEAIRAAYRLSKAGDCVLIAGKGAETTMEMGGRKVPYSDYAVLEDLS